MKTKIYNFTYEWGDNTLTIFPAHDISNKDFLGIMIDRDINGEQTSLSIPKDTAIEMAKFILECYEVENA